MIISPEWVPRFCGKAVEVPKAQELLDALAACMVGERARQPLRVAYEVAERGETHVEQITLLVVTAVEFSAYSEHMVVAGRDNEYNDFVLRLRRYSAVSSEILTDYIEIF